MTRAQMLVWSAVSGLAVGLLFGVALLGVVTLGANVVGISDRLVERLKGPTLVLLLAIVPLIATVLGYLEGRAKLP